MTANSAQNAAQEPRKPVSGTQGRSGGSEAHRDAQGTFPTDAEREAGHDPCAVWRESVAQHKEALRTALARAEAAEAAVARVRALVDAAPTVAVHVGGGNLVDRRRMVSADDLRAALDGGQP